MARLTPSVSAMVDADSPAVCIRWVSATFHAFSALGRPMACPRSRLASRAAVRRTTLVYIVPLAVAVEDGLFGKGPAEGRRQAGTVGGQSGGSSGIGEMLRRPTGADVRTISLGNPRQTIRQHTVAHRNGRVAGVHRSNFAADRTILFLRSFLITSDTETSESTAISVTI